MVDVKSISTEISNMWWQVWLVITGRRGLWWRSDALARHFVIAPECRPNVLRQAAYSEFDTVFTSTEFQLRAWNRAQNLWKCIDINRNGSAARSISQHSYNSDCKCCSCLNASHSDINKKIVTPVAKGAQNGSKHELTDSQWLGHDTWL